VSDTNDNGLAGIVRQWRDLGIPMLPAGGDGCKPGEPPPEWIGKAPTCKWGEIADGTRPPTDDEIDRCIKKEAALAACGKVAGNLVVFDFEVLELAEQFLAALPPELVARFYIQATRRGLHIWIRCDAGATIRQQDLAKLDTDTLLVELRGNGHLIMVAGSVIRHRDTGETFTYTVRQGSIDSIPNITDAEFEMMIALARSFNVYVESETELNPDHRAKRDLSGDSDVERVRAAVKHIGAWRASGYHDWVHVGMAMHGAGLGVSDFLSFSALCRDKFNESNARKKWDSFNSAGRRGYRAGSLFFWAKVDTGWTPPRPGKLPEQARALEDASAYELEAPGDGDQQGGDAEIVTTPIVRCVADIVPKEKEWLWAGRFRIGKLNIVCGPGGDGKTIFSWFMGACITNGTNWPDGSPCPQGSILYLSAEDDPAEDIQPGLKAAGADLSKCHILEAVQRFSAATNQKWKSGITFQDIEAIRLAVEMYHPVAVVIDPIGNYLGGTVKMGLDNEIRSLMLPLLTLAAEKRFALIALAHTRKASSTKADDLVLGSRAFTTMARSVYHLMADPDDRERRLLLPGKINGARKRDGMAFTFRDDGHGNAYIVFEAESVKLTADDAMENACGGVGRPATERAEAVSWLKQELADRMPHRVADLLIKAEAIGINRRTLERASAHLKVVREKTFGGPGTWRLPPNLATPSGSKNIGETGSIGETDAPTTPNSAIINQSRHNSLYLKDSGGNGKRVGLPDIGGRG
jgi:putative DNA primase/helicase